MLAVFAGNPATTVISAYSPTNVSEDGENKPQFYNNLRVAFQDRPAHNILVIVDDFNARLGHGDVRFPYHDATNRNGKYLADLLTENSLIGANTCFPKRHGKRWSFLDRASLVNRQLDYILVRNKWRNSVLNAEAYNGFGRPGSDHRCCVHERSS